MNGLACPIEMRRLLFATDGSQSCKGALTEAINLAKICSAKLFVVSVVTSNREYESALIWHMEQAESKLRGELEPIRRRAAEHGIACEIITRRGEDPCLEIVNEAEKNKVGLVIMGTHGRAGVWRLIAGSVTGKVIGHSPCNVLVVPPLAQIEHRNVLVAIDGSMHSAAALSQAIALAKICGSSLVISSVSSSAEENNAAEENVRNAAALAKKEGIAVEGIVLHGKPHEEIVETARQKNVDLIVIGRQGKTGFKDLLLGSVTERVIGYSQTAVLVANAE